MTKVSKKELESISTPSSVKTFWGTLEFSEGNDHKTQPREARDRKGRFDGRTE
jgi:hypothetical protein